MRVFVTGATGFVGSAIVENLIQAGHQVLGLARSEAGSDALTRLGAGVYRGDLSDTAGLAAGARQCDGVIHTAYNHDFTQFAAAGETDRRAVEALGSALVGTGKPLVVTSAIGLLTPGRPTTEEDEGDPHSPGAVRIPSEKMALGFASQGVRSSIIRLPIMVHDRTRQGFATRLAGLARQTGVSAYIGDGLNRWPAVHRLDAADLFRLALESGATGSRYHAIAEEGVTLRTIADAIGRKLDVPVVAKSPDKAAEHFGFVAYFVGADFQAASAQTKRTLGWNPTRHGVVADLEAAE